ncbi:MAG: VWA domain-containing protein [Gaiella sp.]|nr:VWA domain-containing protein [Gaiella sp.]
MTFGWPLALVGLALIPALAAVYVAAGRRRRRAAARFANPALVPNLVPSSPAWRRHVAPALALAALALLVVGIARPHVVRSVTRDEATVVLAIDVSRSMAAQDVQPSRFEAAKRAALVFLDQLPGNYSVGIVSFSTSADPVLPPTTDREAAKTALAELRLGSGTAIGNAIARSVDLALDQRPGRQAEPASSQRAPAAVLLLSDGAQTAGTIRPGPAAQRARRLGVPVSTVALGTGNAVVEVPRPGGLSERVTVAPDVSTLRLVARTTGGSFSAAPDAARLESVYRELGTRLARDRKRVEVTSAFAAGGAVLLLIGGTLSSLWFRRVL